MDGSRFDTFVKTLAMTPLTRSTVLRGVAASAAALAGVRLAPEPGAAKKKNNEKRVKVCLCDPASCHTKTVKKANRGKVIRRNAPCASKGKCTSSNPCAAQTLGCTPSCEQRICGDNGCGGSCGTCGAGQVCANGRCASSCPGGQKVCAGNCIPNNQCCTSSDCPASSPTCCGGACVNVPSDVRNCGACGTRCEFNEQCLGGVCVCIDPVLGPRPCTSGNSCCTSGFCDCFAGFFLDPRTCQAAMSCPGGPAEECIDTTTGCRACCPPGTTCSAAGRCLID